MSYTISTNNSALIIKNSKNIIEKIIFVHTEDFNNFDKSVEKSYKLQILNFEKDSATAPKKLNDLLERGLLNNSIINGTKSKIYTLDFLTTYPNAITQQNSILENPFTALDNFFSLIQHTGQFKILTNKNFTEKFPGASDAIKALENQSPKVKPNLGALLELTKNIDMLEKNEKVKSQIALKNLVFDTAQHLIPQNLKYVASIAQAKV